MLYIIFHIVQHMQLYVTSFRPSVDVMQQTLMAVAQLSITMTVIL